MSNRRRGKLFRHTRRNKIVGGKTPTYSRTRSSRIKTEIIDNSLQKDNCKGENLFHSYDECADKCNHKFCNKKIYTLPDDPQDVFIETHRYSPHKPRHHRKIGYRTQRAIVPRDWKLII